MDINVDVGIILAAGSGLIGVCAYFFKKVDRRVDTTAQDVVKLRNDFIDLRRELVEKLAEMRDRLKEDMEEVFNGTCHERQDSCGRLQDTKFKSVEAREQTICAKISRLETDRKTDWAEQKDWNRRTEEKLRNGGVR